METVWWPGYCGERNLYDALWTLNLTRSTGVPTLPSCFQQTIVTWCSYGLSLIVCIIYAAWLLKQPKLNRVSQLSGFNIFKTLLCVLLISCELTSDIWRILVALEYDGSYLVLADYVAFSIRISALFLITYVTVVEFLTGVASSGVVCLFWVCAISAETLHLYSTLRRWERNDPYVDDVYFVSKCVYFSLVTLQFLCVFRADLQALPNGKRSVSPEEAPLLNKNPKMQKTSSMGKRSTDTPSSQSPKTSSPATSCSFLMRFTFLWFFSIIRKSLQKPLVYNDLPGLSTTHSTSYLLKKFNRHYYSRDVDSHGSPKKTSGLARALTRTMWPDLAVAMIYRLVNIAAALACPIFLQMLIRFMEYRMLENTGFMFATMLLVVTFVNTLFIDNFLFASCVCGMRARTILTSLIYRKILKLSSTARQQTGASQIVDMLSSDMQKIQDLFLYTLMLCSSPLLLVLTMGYLWWLVGSACLAGLFLLLIIVPLNTVVFVRKGSQYQLRQQRLRSERMTLLEEILNCIKAVKMNALEGIFKKRVSDIREKELKLIKKVNYSSIFGSFCWLLSPYLVSVAIFFTYVYIKSGTLDAEIIFVTLSLINLLNWPMSLLPMGFANTIKGIVALRRITKFLQLEEKDSQVGDDNQVYYGRSNDDFALKLRRSSYSSSRHNRPVVRNVDLDIPRGSLVAVVGLSGCGKTALMKAFMGEMYRIDGKAFQNGNMAYVPTKPWVVEGSIQDNILMEKPFVAGTYQSVLEACDLTVALQRLPYLDMTHIGPKQDILSRAELQCLGLARAVYHDEDIYLLDDPLSSLEEVRARQIFDRVIGPKGLLRNKTRVLVTHDLTLLSSVDNIYYMESGCIAEKGRLQQLVGRNGDLADFVRSYIAVENPCIDVDALGPKDIILNLVQRRSASRRQGRKRTVSRSSSSRSYQRMGSRSMSVMHTSSIENSTRASMSVGFYLDAFGKVTLAALALVTMLLVAVQASTIYSLVHLTNYIENGTNSDIPTVDHWILNNGFLGAYGYWGLAQAVLCLLVSFIVARGCYTAARALHTRVLNGVLHAPFTFWDGKSSHSVILRLSADLNIVDVNISSYLRHWVIALVPVCTTLIIILVVTNIAAIFIFIFLVLFLILQRTYGKVSKDLKRLDSAGRAPLYDHVTETVASASSIRAYNKQEQFVETFDRLLDKSQRSWYLVLASYRWCGICIEFLGACIIFCAAFLAIWSADDLSGGELGVTVTLALSVTLYLNALSRNTNDMGENLCSLRHVQEYASIEMEDSWQLAGDQPPEEWPEKGTVCFEDYCVRPLSSQNLALRDLHVLVNPGERIGVVSENPQDKSSFLLSLFRMTDPICGRIVVDGYDIDNIGLYALRSKISSLTKRPAIFQGDILFNMDSEEQYNIREIWNALDKVHLKHFVTSLPSRLKYDCGRKGSNLSLSQCQLLCLARAILHSPTILILDEPTALVDSETEHWIELAIRTHFKQSTIFHVPAKLDTLLDCDKVLVVEDGAIVEFASPDKLLANPSSLFYSIAVANGLNFDGISC